MAKSKYTPKQKKQRREAVARYYERHKEKVHRAVKEYQKREKAEHPERFKRRSKVQTELRAGRMKKPATCQYPGCDTTSGLEYDHTTKRWLCEIHHARGGAAKNSS